MNFTLELDQDPGFIWGLFLSFMSDPPAQWHPLNCLPRSRQSSEEKKSACDRESECRMMKEMLAFNEEFVRNREYQSYVTDKYPDKKIAILTCMDTRLTELLPKALNLRNGDAKIIKNAGAILTQPFGSAMRSLLIAIHDMDVQEVLVIGHHGCGMTNLDADAMVKKFIDNGISEQAIMTLESAGIKMSRFLQGFPTAEEGVRHSVDMIRRHPLVPAHIPVYGCVMDPTTGRIEVIIEGSATKEVWRKEQKKLLPVVPFD